MRRHLAGLGVVGKTLSFVNLCPGLGFLFLIVYIKYIFVCVLTIINSLSDIWVVLHRRLAGLLGVVDKTFGFVAVARVESWGVSVTYFPCSGHCLSATLEIWSP